MVLEVPHLGADLVDELRVVRDDDDAALVEVDRLRHRAERVAVEVVGRFVQDDNVRRVPHGRGQHDLDLLATRECAHASVRRKLRLKPHVVQVAFDELLGQRADELRRLGGDALVRVLEQLGEARRHELLAGDPRREAGFALPLDLVLLLLGLVRLAAAVGDSSNTNPMLGLQAGAALRLSLDRIQGLAVLRKRPMAVYERGGYWGETKIPPHPSYALLKRAKLTPEFDPPK